MAGFKDLMARMAELEGIPSRIAKEVAEGISALVADEFAGSHDPYGKPWKPLLPQTVRRKGGDTRILRRTDAMSSGITVKPTAGSGIAIDVGNTSTPYGEYHQSGTKHMVARKILPDGSSLPKAWEAVIEEASARAFKKVLK